MGRADPGMAKAVCFTAFVWLAISLFPVQPTFAQTSEPDVELPAAALSDFVGDGGINLTDSNTSNSFMKRLASRWPEDLLLAPVPGRSPQFGWSLALGAGYFLQTSSGEGEEGGEREAAPSILGGFAWYAENGSYAYGLGGNLHLRNDDVRVMFGAGYMDVTYRYYGIGRANSRGISLDVLQNGPLYFGSASYRVWNKLYLGLGYLGGSIETRPRLKLDEIGPDFDPTVDTDIGGITIPIQYDSRDHERFPRDGWLITGRTNLYRENLASDFDATTFSVSVNKYLPFRQRDVLAFRGYFRSTFGDAPFFLLSAFGGGTDLRGYPSGRYRDRMMYALQGEYRWQFHDRWILTGFAGVGEVASEVSGFGNNFLPAAGLGARFVLSDKHRVSLSFDVARGKDGTEYYFGVGESF